MNHQGIQLHPYFQRRHPAENKIKPTLYGITTRAVTLAEPVDPDNLQWVIASEQPAQVCDWQLDRVVDEVLLMDGAVYPGNGQVPLLDCHNRWTCDDQLGSVSGFKIATIGDYQAITGVVRFAQDEKSARTKQKVLDKHITDGSAGYRVLNAVWVPDGVSVTIRGRAFAGPLNVLS